MTSIRTNTLACVALALAGLAGGRPCLAQSSADSGLMRDLDRISAELRRTETDIDQVQQRISDARVTVVQLGADLDNGKDPAFVKAELLDVSAQLDPVETSIAGIGADLQRARTDLQQIMDAARRLRSGMIMLRARRELAFLGFLSGRVGDQKSDLVSLRSEIARLFDKIDGM